MMLLRATDCESSCIDVHLDFVLILGVVIYDNLVNRSILFQLASSCGCHCPLRFPMPIMGRVTRFCRDNILLSFREEASDFDHVPSRWKSKDMDPVPQSQQKWEWYHVGGFWVAESFSAATIQISSAAVALGLNPVLALVAYSIGNLIIAIPCCASGYIGSKFSMNFPVVARASVHLIRSSALY